MKKICLIILNLFALTLLVRSQNIGVGTSSPHASAILDVSSTTKGLLIPRMTTAQRNAIVTPATGLLIWQTDGTTGFYYYNGSGWSAFAAGAPIPLTGWATTGNTGTDSTCGCFLACKQKLSDLAFSSSRASWF